VKQVKLVNLALQGFRSFNRDTVFPFPANPGLFLLDGRNGAGKSSVWAALCWLLYGKTDRGLKAGDVANWSREELTSVVGEFEIDGKPCALTRTWDPNSLNVEWGDGEPRPIEQEQVNELMGLDYESFLATVLVSQFGTTFFDMEATDRLRVFGEALDLGYWEEKGDLARQKAREVSEALLQAKGALESKQGRLQALRESKKSLKGQLKTHREQVEQSTKEIREEIKWAKHAKEVEAPGLDKAKGRYRRWVDYRESLVREVSRAWERDREIGKEMARIEVTVETTQKEITRLLEQRKDLTKLKGRCPTCLQNIKTGHTHKAGEEIDRLIEWEQGEAHRFRQRLAVFMVKAEKSSKRLKRLGLDHDEAETKVKKWQDIVGKTSRRLSELDDELEQYNRKLTEVSGVSPLQEEYTRVKNDFFGTQGEVADLIVKVEKLEAEQIRYTQWADLFKELRLWLMEEALAELEIAVNNAISQLGLEGWTVAFDVERETKSGTISKKFHVLISSPDHDEPVKWAAWSGGETQRLRIAGVIGLATVIRSRRGVDYPLEVWDEPTTGVEEDGIQDMLTFLQSRAREEKRQIWLIDHRSLTFGFDGHVSIKKTNMGSKVIVRKGDA
jgi:DNA repair exonuclease SbcCD ATPase subunit